METKQKSTKVVVSLLALVGLVAFSLFAVGGSLEPNSPPGPTMKTLDELYDTIVSASPSVSQKEGYTKYFLCPADANTTILTVPAGKRFVLRKLWVRRDLGSWEENWAVNGGPNLYIQGSITYTKYTDGQDGRFDYALMYEFPEGCAVVEGPNDLTFTNYHTSLAYRTHFVGYSYDVP